MEKEKSELIQEALDTLQAVTLSGRSTESYVAELFEDIRNLEEENKKLKECNKSQSEVINNVFIPEKERLEEENKNLKTENEKLKEAMKELNNYK